MATPYRFAALAPICLLVLFGMICLSPLAGAEDEPAPPEKAPAKETPAKETPAKEDAATSATPVLKLVSNGAEPRQVLTYAPTADTTVDFSTSDTVDVKHPMGQMKFGPIKSTVRMVYSKSAAKDHVPVSAEITAASMVADATNPMAAPMKQKIEASKGTKLTGSLSGCGVWTSTPGGEMLTQAQESLGAQMGRYFPLLPTEAVGVGAKWTTTVLLSVNGVPQTSIVTTEITKIEGSRIECSEVETRTAKDQKMKIMGQEVPIKSVTGKGKGTLVLDLALGGVVKSASSISTETVMLMMGSEMTSTTVLTSSVSSKAPAAVTAGSK